MMPKFMSTNPTHGKVYLIQHYVIKKFDRDLQQVGGFLRVLQSPPPIKLTTNDLIEILLKAQAHGAWISFPPPPFSLLPPPFFQNFHINHSFFKIFIIIRFFFI